MQQGEVRVYGATWCSRCWHVRKFLAERRVPYRFFDIDSDEAARRFVEGPGIEGVMPVAILPDGTVLIEPDDNELTSRLGLESCPTCRVYDAIVVGSGPAGLTGAFYSAREGMEVLVVEKGAPGGWPGTIGQVENFPGFPEGIAGAELAGRLIKQCERFGVEMKPGIEATALGADGDMRWLKLADGTEVRAAGVLLSPGNHYRLPGVPGEDKFLGAGIHFCATCDGPLYRGKDVLVLGGGNAAVQEGAFLTRFARKVTIATHGPELRASRTVVEAARRNPRIEILTNVSVEEFRGAERLASVLVHDPRTGEKGELHPDGVFIFIGLEPNTAWLQGTVDLDRAGFIVTDQSYQTKMLGVFAAGDARSGSTKQMVIAAGEGAAAALKMREYLEHIRVLPSIMG